MTPDLVQRMRDSRATEMWCSFLDIGDAAIDLTPQGAALWDLVKRDMKSDLGDRWLQRAGSSPAGSATIRLPEITDIAPAWTTIGPAAAYLNAIRFWASIQIVKAHGVPNVQKTLALLHTDITSSRFLHTGCQFMLAAIALHLDYDPVLEPDRDSSPGDLSLRTKTTEVMIEIVTIADNQTFVAENTSFAESTRLLSELSEKYTVHFSGNVPGYRPNHLAAWRTQVEEAAAYVAHVGVEMTVMDGEWLGLRVVPGLSTKPTYMFGPPLVSAHEQRFADRIRSKAVQTDDALSAWVWVVDASGRYLRNHIDTMPIEDKVAIVARTTADVRTNYPHLAGIVRMSLAYRHPVETVDITVNGPLGSGFVQASPHELVREATLIPGLRCDKDQRHIMTSTVCDQIDWLDWALQALGVGVTSSELLVDGQLLTQND